LVEAVNLGEPGGRVGHDAAGERVEDVEQGRQGGLEDRDNGVEVAVLGLGVEAHYGGLLAVGEEVEVGDSGHVRLDGRVRGLHEAATQDADGQVAAGVGRRRGRHC
jgi:hypothetical protein